MNSAAPPDSPASPEAGLRSKEVRDEVSVEVSSAKENSGILATSQSQDAINEEVCIQKPTVGEPAVEEVPVLEDSDVVASVDLQEGDTIETGVNVASGELNNWSRVSPSKVGRSPGRSVQQSQADEFQISGSKFSVLGVDDEEEGEIMEEAPQTIFVGGGARYYWSVGSKW
ncbi:hypothetical protein Rs2_45678 [Raphanus sativus]|nr:hypothetical protein Rs2_45678 [Raphanus sativus]